MGGIIIKIKEQLIVCKAMVKSSSLFCSRRVRNIRKRLFKKLKRLGVNSIPIFIISYNRLSYVEQMISWLEKAGYTNIHIIDNASTYPPLLAYYKTIPYKVHIMEKNYGYMVFWKCKEFEKYRRYFYVVSDPDLTPISDCPDNYIEYFASVLKKYSNVNKVGFSLKITDIPDENAMKKSILAWESEFYKRKFIGGKLYYAGIDTTFALYMPDFANTSDSFYRALRTAAPYQAMHLPWYKSKDQVSEEDYYYSKHKTNGWWDVTKDEVSDEGACTDVWKNVVDNKEI